MTSTPAAEAQTNGFPLPREVPLETNAAPPDLTAPVETDAVPAPQGALTPVRTNAAPAGFLIEKGFQLALVASEPLISSPVAMAFDENGRLFVVELPGFGEELRPPHTRGRVVLLEDTKGEGVFNSSVVYADGLASPSAIACYDGGVFVAAATDILYLKETTCGGRADVKRTVFTGFGGPNPTENLPALLNSFKWGLDNRIHAVAAGLGGTITSSGEQRAGAVSLDDMNFSFDPRSLTLFPEAGPAQSGLCFDALGRKFLSDFTRPLRFPMYDAEYLLRNPYAPAPPEIIDVESPATTVYHLAPPEAPTAPAERTNRTAATLTTVAQTNRMAPVWLSSAQGATIYRGDSFPQPYLGNAFINDPAHHLVHRAVLRMEGIEPVAARAASERGSEFLVSSDDSFRPAQIINAPDGDLYLADCNEGSRGRIYRIAPLNSRAPRPLKLGSAGAYQLVVELASPNGWRRETAARLLYERRPAAAVRMLTNMVNRSNLPLARLTALHVLEGLGALSEAALFKALNDPNPEVRGHALRLAENAGRGGSISSGLWSQVRKAASDPDLSVRHQLAWSVGAFQDPGKARALAEVLGRDVENTFIRAAALNSLATGGADQIAALNRVPSFMARPTGQDFLKELAAMIGTSGRLDEVSQAISFLSRPAVPALERFALLGALGEGLHRTRSSLALADSAKSLGLVYNEALSAAPDSGAAPVLRVAALRLLAASPYTYSDVRDWLLLMLSPGEPPNIQFAAMTALARYNDSRVTADVVQRWPAMANPNLRLEAVALLLERRERAPEVIKAAETGKIPISDFPSTQVNFLRTYPDPDIAQRALKLFGPTTLERPAALARYLPAERFPGSPTRGRQIFTARCAACHRLGGEGHWLGPDLAGAKVAGNHRILEAVLEPNLQPNPNYRTAVIETSDSEFYIGTIPRETAITVTLLQPGGAQIVLPRGNINSVAYQSWSLMPEGLDQGMSVQAMADLLAYVMTTPR